MTGRRKWFLRTIVALLAVVALFYGGGGWYFSGQIGQDVVLRDPYSTGNDLSWQFTTNDSVTITPRVPGDALPEPATTDVVYGLIGEQTRVVIGPVLSTAPTSVQRQVETRDGAVYWNSAGLPKGPDLRRPSESTTGGLFRDVWEDPTQIGLPYKDVMVRAPIGDLPAWFVPAAEPSDTWAIMVHGRGGSRTEPLRALIGVHRAGLPALVVTYRNDVGAPTAPNGRYGFGQTEWPDLQAAVQYALQRGAQRVVLYGISMGGGIVAAFMQNSPLSSDVTAMVLDAPLLDIQQTIAFGASQRQLPVVGLPIPSSLTWTAEQMARLRYGSDWWQATYLDDTSWVSVPTLVFHGQADTTVPISTSDQLATSVPDRVTLVSVADADHVESWNINPDAYTDQLITFLKVDAAS